MLNRQLQIQANATTRPAIEAALSGLTESLEDAALEQARIHERRAKIESVNVSMQFDSETRGSVRLDFEWTVRNACADQTFADKGQLSIPFVIDGRLLTLRLPPEPVEREPDEI